MKMHDQYATVGIKPNCKKSRKLKDARLVCGTLESERFEEIRKHAGAVTILTTPIPTTNLTLHFEKK